MRRADRLYRLVELLRGGRLTTARRLSERLEVSERTIYRDIADLMASGVPIEGEAGVGYVMRPGFDLPPLMFTRPEVSALVTGARLVQAWGGRAMAGAAADALAKIAAVMPPDLARAADRVPIHAFETPDLDAATRARLDLLDDAIDRRTRLAMDYRDEAGTPTLRHVRPLSLVFWGKVWTLIAWCELRDDFRMFRVDRMRRLTAAGTFADAPGRTLDVFYACDGHGPPAGS
ncbi:helix-turn-helix transcriptional regulator [Palleronia rufa]|uniref:helix-turn-helix transcriptional regulator n=1 Tax=Palleronia rufa TaxID=1530186 RepID=UPI000566D743|nr:YafY family protein [Palleronia rufa]